MPSTTTPRALSLQAPPLDIAVRRPLTAVQMFAMGIPFATVKPQGRCWSRRPVPAIRVTQSGLWLDPARIEAYRRACAYGAQPGGVPLPYPEIHFTPLMAEAIVTAKFPVSPLGLIHVEQTLCQHHALRPGDTLDASATLGALRETRRGVEVDFDLALTRDGVRVWSGVTSLLSRSADTRAGGHRKPGATSAPEPGPATLVLDVPGDTGLAYARASGDWNPHHLWWFTARPLGYRRPIAHGMWTFARTLAEALRGVSPEAPVQATAAFKRPIMMPGRIHMDAPEVVANGSPSPLEVRDPRTGAPHLRGTVALVR